jgi:hypothetical protein
MPRTRLTRNIAPHTVCDESGTGPDAGLAARRPKHRCCRQRLNWTARSPKLSTGLPIAGFHTGGPGRTHPIRQSDIACDIAFPSCLSVRAYSCGVRVAAPAIPVPRTIREKRPLIGNAVWPYLFHRARGL